MVGCTQEIMTMILSLESVDKINSQAIFLNIITSHDARSECG